MKKDYGSNSYYMGLVQNLYASTNGCLTAFLQFLYQHEISRHFQEFESCFRALYQKEIENCQILSQILLDMGGDPQFFSSSRKYLNTHSVTYVKEIDKVFLTDIEFLEINILDLKSAILKIENVQIKENLKTILNNKKMSLKILKENYFKNHIVQ